MLPCDIYKENSMSKVKIGKDIRFLILPFCRRFVNFPLKLFSKFFGGECRCKSVRSYDYICQNFNKFNIYLSKRLRTYLTQFIMKFFNTQSEVQCQSVKQSLLNLAGLPTLRQLIYFRAHRYINPLPTSEVHG